MHRFAWACMDMPALHNAAMNHATQLMLKPDQYNSSVVPLASQTAGVATTLPWIPCMYLRLHIYAIYNIYYIIIICYFNNIQSYTVVPYIYIYAHRYAYAVINMCMLPFRLHADAFRPKSHPQDLFRPFAA